MEYPMAKKSTNLQGFLKSLLLPGKSAEKYSGGKQKKTHPPHTTNTVDLVHNICDLL